MAGSLGRLARVLDETAKVTELGASLKAGRVYYECRKFIRPRQIAHPEGSIRYLGALERKAQCVSACTGSEPPVGALSADKIRYECGGKPHEPEEFHKTKAHRGVRGLLEDDVFCEISAPLVCVPQSRRG